MLSYLGYLFGYTGETPSAQEPETTPETTPETDETIENNHEAGLMLACKSLIEEYRKKNQVNESVARKRICDMLDDYISRNSTIESVDRSVLHEYTKPPNRKTSRFHNQKCPYNDRNKVAKILRNQPTSHQKMKPMVKD